jgi:diguanylate cyclase (GGDEF)-like protein
MSLRDGLTGLANRRAFDERLLVEWRRSKRQGQALALLMMDIDHFKQYNDHCGHVEGDRCIQAVAEVLSHTASRATDMVARYGGEEFAILLPQTQTQEAMELAGACQNALAARALPHPNSGASPWVSLSIGVASLCGDEGDPERLLLAADAALYRAKRGGRNRVAT